MKKVLFIVNSLSGGGAERVVTLLANYMAEKNNKVYIICFDTASTFILHPKVKVIFLGRNTKGFWNIMRNKSKLERTIRNLEREESFDLITVHLLYSHLITRLGRCRNRAVYVMHSIYSRKFKRNIIFRLLIKFIYKNRSLISVSEGLKQELINYWNLKNNTKIAVINNPLDIEYIREKASEKLLIDGKYIISVGRLTAVKRYDYLIKAFMKTKLKEDYKLIILGEGEEKQKLTQLVSQLKAESCIMLKGWEENPIKWIENASLYVCTSKYECFPMTLLECLCCATPIVSVDCDYGPREILKGELKKFLVEDNCMDKLTIAMEEAVNNYPTISEEYYSFYDIKNISEQYLNSLKGDI